MAVSDDQTTSSLTDAVDASHAWLELAPDYERARTREDSLDRLVEWPAQRDLLGDVTGRSVLDLGCGNGGKIAELVREGAAACVGVDVSGNFLSTPAPGLELVTGDLNELDAVPGLAGRTFDRILFLQSFGYANDPVRTLRASRAMLADDGFILLTKTQPRLERPDHADQASLHHLRPDQRVQCGRAVDRDHDRASTAGGRPTPLSAQAGLDEQVPRHPGLQAPAPSRPVAERF